MSCSEAKGEHKDGSSSLIPESTSVASRCVANTKPDPQADALGQVNRPFSQADLGCVSVWCLCSALGLVACQELSLQLFRSCGAQKCKLQLPEPGNQGTFPVWITFAYSLSEAAGECRVKACPPALSRQWESTGLGSTHCFLQGSGRAQAWGTPSGFSGEAGEGCDCTCLQC